MYQQYTNDLINNQAILLSEQLLEIIKKIIPNK